jgi:hypothetical protein
VKSMILSSRLAPKFCSLWTSSISLTDSSSRVFFFLPNFLMFRGILVFVQCIQTRFTEDGLNFISSAILLVLSPLFLARMIYLIFYLLALQLYSSFPCHIGGYIKSKVSGLHSLLASMSYLIWIRSWQSTGQRETLSAGQLLPRCTLRVLPPWRQEAIA